MKKGKESWISINDSKNEKPRVKQYLVNLSTITLEIIKKGTQLICKNSFGTDNRLKENTIYIASEDSWIDRNGWNTVPLDGVYLAYNSRRFELSYIEKLKYWEAEIPLLNKDDLISKTIKSYNHYKFKKHQFMSMNLNIFSPEEDLNREIVNFLRHETKDYNKLLIDIYEMHNKADCYVIIKNKVLDKIIEVYPFLITECNRVRSEIYLSEDEKKEKHIKEINKKLKQKRKKGSSPCQLAC